MSDDSDDSAAPRRVPAVSNFHSIVSARKNKRCALDGHAYTIDEFKAYYGEATAEMWQSAPHFIQMREFCDFFNLCLTYPVTAILPNA
jgi:hypothetical protein